MSFLWSDFARNVSAAAPYHRAAYPMARPWDRRAAATAGAALTPAEAVTGLPARHAFAADEGKADARRAAPERKTGRQRTFS